MQSVTTCTNIKVLVFNYFLLLQVLREVLWQLRCPTTSPLFSINSSAEVAITPLFSLPSLTKGALSSLLKETLPALSSASRLHSFLLASENHPIPPRTLEAYCSGLRAFLLSLSSFLFTVEQEVVKQEGSEGTLLATLARLRPWLSKLTQVAAVHATATKDWERCDNWESSVRLLSVLYNAVTTCSSPVLLPVFLDLLLRSLRPYFIIIQTWLTEGRLEDWRNEFIFHKREGVEEEGEDFWSSVFLTHDYKTGLEKEGIAPLRLLQGLDTKILASGKSIEILHRCHSFYLYFITFYFLSSSHLTLSVFLTAIAEGGP